MVSDSGNLRLLGTWNQVAMRGYVRQVFCFPIEKQLDDFDKLCTHIQDRLSLACAHFPHFAGKIFLGQTNGEVYLLTTANDVVPFKFFDHRRDEESLFGWSYPELRAQGFPCKAFVGPWFDLPHDLTEDGPGIPVVEVHARVIRDGGLLLCIFMHHSITDGAGMCNFISTFANYTCRGVSGAESNAGSDVKDDVENGQVDKLKFAANIVLIPGKLAWSLVRSLVGLKCWLIRPKAVKAAVKTAVVTADKNGIENGQAIDIKYPANIDMDIPDNETTTLLEVSSFDELMNKCPEYIRLPQPTGPTAPCTRREWELSLGDVPKTGRIFKFSQARIRALQALAQNGTQRHVSTFACVAGVTWWFCTAARREGHQPQEQTTPSTNRHDGHKGSQAEEAHLLVPVWWKRRAYQSDLAEYAGNAVCLPRISASLGNNVVIGNGIGERQPSPSVNASQAATPTDERLGQVICSIDSAIGAVDDRFVATRTAMFRAAPDPRFVGLNLDSQDPSDFIFNSWRHLGADNKFWFPGLKLKGKPRLRGRRAEAVRRAQPRWTMGAGLVLPGKKYSMYEVCVTLDEASMMRLLANKEWQKWTEQTVE